MDEISAHLSERLVFYIIQHILSKTDVTLEAASGYAKQLHDYIETIKPYDNRHMIYNYIQQSTQRYILQRLCTSETPTATFKHIVQVLHVLLTGTKMSIQQQQSRVFSQIFHEIKTTGKPLLQFVRERSQQLRTQRTSTGGSGAAAGGSGAAAGGSGAAAGGSEKGVTSFEELLELHLMKDDTEAEKLQKVLQQMNTPGEFWAKVQKFISIITSILLRDLGNKNLNDVFDVLLYRVLYRMVVKRQGRDDLTGDDEKQFYERYTIKENFRHGFTRTLIDLKKRDRFTEENIISIVHQTVVRLLELLDNEYMKKQQSAPLIPAAVPLQEGRGGGKSRGTNRNARKRAAIKRAKESQSTRQNAQATLMQIQDKLSLQRQLQQRAQIQRLRKQAEQIQRMKRQAQQRALKQQTGNELLKRLHDWKSEMKYGDTMSNMTRDISLLSELIESTGVDISDFTEMADFKCSLSLDFFRDPVIFGDNIYQRQYIQRWVQTSRNQNRRLRQRGQPPKPLLDPNTNRILDQGQRSIRQVPSKSKMQSLYCKREQMMVVLLGLVNQMSLQQLLHSISLLDGRSRPSTQLRGGAAV